MNIRYTFIHPGPDDTVDDLDFSLFQSHEDILYDALADLSFDDDDVVINISDCIEQEERWYGTVCPGRL